MQLKNLIHFKAYIISLISGLLLKFAFNENGNVIFVIISFLILFRLLDNKQLSSFTIGYLFGLGYYLSTLIWLPTSFKCVYVPVVYGYFSLLILSLFLALYIAIPCYLCYLCNLSKLKFAILYSFCEYLRGIIFPWNLIGYTAYKIPYFCQIVDTIGPYGLTFLIILILELIYNKNFKYAISICLVIFSYGFYKINWSHNYILPKTQFDVTLVHPLIKQEDKLNPKLLWENIERHLDLSLGKIVIWPETAINTVFNQYILKALPNIPMIIGSNRVEGNNIYNSLFVIDKNEIIQIYDKQRLVLFGEYIPNWICTVVNTIMPGLLNCGFSPGKFTKSINKYNCAANICYEIIFPNNVIDNKENTWILNLTNDGWFDNTDEPYQHLISSCFRAIEEGKPIARCNNMGVSCFIDCYGNVIKKINDQAGNITYKMPQKYITTIYSKYGNKVFFLLLVMFILSIHLIKKRSLGKTII